MAVLANRTKYPKQAWNLFQASTFSIKVEQVQRYATPLHRHSNSTILHAPMEAVLPILHSTKRRLATYPQSARAIARRSTNWTCGEERTHLEGHLQGTCQQYDHLGYIVPFTTRTKILVQNL